MGKLIAKTAAITLACILAAGLLLFGIFSLFVLPADLYAMAAMFVLFYPATDFPCAWDALIALAVVLATVCLRIVLAVSFFVDLHRTRKAEKQREQDGQPARLEAPSEPAR